MRTQLRRRLPFALTLASLSLILGGVVLLGTGLLSAQDPTPTEGGNTPRTEDEAMTRIALQLPRPDESTATNVEAARTALSQLAGVKNVLGAVEEGDVEAILALARKGNYCAQSLREPLPGCVNTETVTGVYHRAIEVMPPTLRPLDTMEEWLSAFFANGAATLEFATLDVRQSDGHGGLYHLVFRLQDPVEPWGSDVPYDQIALIVTSDVGEPIQEIAFGTARSNGLQWIQAMGGEDGARNHELLTPESVANWEGFLDEGRLPR